VPPLELPQPLERDALDKLAKESAHALTSQVLDA
jgi:hypothetical protein